ncbi:MAG: hypothetical protein AAGF59_11205 [Pseudomonadota bacterium]
MTGTALRLLAYAGAFAIVLVTPVQSVAAWLETQEGCRVHMEKPPEAYGASWTGGCADGVGSGPGVFAMTTEADGEARTSRIFGTMQAGRFVGRVRLETATGDAFEGVLADGRLNEADVAFADGRRYRGQLLNAVPHGRGTMIYPGGARYDGSWRQDLKHGAGSYTTVKGMVIVGTFRDDRLTGKARFNLPDGTWYEGPTRDQRPHGRGTCARPAGAAPTPCLFRNGQFVR